MKLIIAILDDQISESTTETLVEQGYSVTKIASTGGFLRRGRTTLLIGLREEKVQDALELLRHHAGVETDTHGRRATIFVLKTEQYAQL
jgi:uncharacterized protein YaaQ